MKRHFYGAGSFAALVACVALVVGAQPGAQRGQGQGGQAPGGPGGAGAQGGRGRGPAGPQMRGDGPAPEAKPFSITKSDPALDQVVAADAKLETIATGFGINEGVLWVPDGKLGYVLVSSLIDNVMYKVTLPDHKMSVFMEKAGYSGNDANSVGLQTRAGRSHVIIIGPNCAMQDFQGRLVWCASQDFAVKRLEKDGTHTTIANSYDGKSFNGPNDITIKSNGTIYIADSDVGLRDGARNPKKVLPNNIYMVKDGKVSIAVTQEVNGGGGNGIVLSTDEKWLYVTAGLRRMKRYPVNADDTLGEGTVFSEGDGITDGMKVDKKGNIYSTSGAGPGVVRVTSPEGKLLGLLTLPVAGGEEPKKQICATNLAFGGDGKDLYIAACHAVYRIRLKVDGVMYGSSLPPGSVPAIGTAAAAR